MEKAFFIERNKRYSVV